MIREKKDTILVVDDDSYVLESVTALLTQCGYDVVSCRNAEEAMVKLQQTGVDTVLTDIKMPVITSIHK